MKTLGQVLDLSSAAADRAAARGRHPAAQTMLNAPYTGVRRSAGVLIGMLALVPADRVDVSIFGDHGSVLVLDYSQSLHAAGDVRVACQALGIGPVEELAADLPDGTAAVELRGSDLLDGVYRIVRAVIAVPATWTSA